MGQEYSAKATSSASASELELVSEEVLVSEVAFEQEGQMLNRAIQTTNPKGRNKFSFIQKLILKGIKKYLNEEIKKIFLD